MAAESGEAETATPATEDEPDARKRGATRLAELEPEAVAAMERTQQDLAVTYRTTYVMPYVYASGLGLAIAHGPWFFDSSGRYLKRTLADIRVGGVDRFFPGESAWDLALSGIEMLVEINILQHGKFGFGGTPLAIGVTQRTVVQRTTPDVWRTEDSSTHFELGRLRVYGRIEHRYFAVEVGLYAPFFWAALPKHGDPAVYSGPLPLLSYLGVGY